jgi:hypothetical protein
MKEVLKQALEALQFAYNHCDSDWVQDEKINPAITAIKQALAQPEQEPVLLLQSHRDGYWCDDLTCKKCYSADFRLKHRSPQRTWQGLTAEEVEKIWQSVEASDFHDCVLPFAKELEAKLKEKNT